MKLQSNKIYTFWEEYVCDNEIQFLYIDIFLFFCKRRTLCFNYKLDYDIVTHMNKKGAHFI